ncbi:MAG: hypothetical protein IT366_15220 [Candidatus Hydrogenedentes bacterium]|nr:hypothetical protein [Candidatus Hydrogenedentota bacterium]
MKRWFCLFFIVALLSATFAGCGATKAREDSSVPIAASKESGNPYPTFAEGGALTLSFNGQSATIKLDDVQLANTDSGYPDYMELSGSGTYFAALIDPKMPDVEGDAYYQPIVGRALPLTVPKDLLPDDREITAPNLGKYTIVGGNLTMEKFQIGMDGRDHWDGRIDLQLQSTRGVIPVSGTFSFTVVPTW